MPGPYSPPQNFPLAARRRDHAQSAVVQSAGYAYRLKGQRLKEVFNRAGKLQHLLLRNTQALLTQMWQTAVCNRHHSLEQHYAAGCC